MVSSVHVAVDIPITATIANTCTRCPSQKIKQQLGLRINIHLTSNILVVVAIDGIAII